MQQPLVLFDLQVILIPHSRSKVLHRLVLRSFHRIEHQQQQHQLSILDLFHILLHRNYVKVCWQQAML